MTNLALIRQLVVALSVCIVAACASGSIAEWEDDSFSSSIDNILIISASDQPIVRRLFEDTFVTELATIIIPLAHDKPSYSQGQ